MISRLDLYLCFALCMGLAGGGAATAATYDETVVGDLSGSPESPTTWPLDPGANTLIAAAGGLDIDLLHIVVPSNHVLASLTLDSYVDSVQTYSFIGVASGAVWPTGLEYDVDPSYLLGWAHFGVIDEASVGDDLLVPMSTALFSPGFTPPLPAGDYTFVIQDVDFPMSYAMTFNVRLVPEPDWSSPALASTIGVAGVGAVGRRKRPSISRSMRF